MTVFPLCPEFMILMQGNFISIVADTLTKARVCYCAQDGVTEKVQEIFNECKSCGLPTTDLCETKLGVLIHCH